MKGMIMAGMMALSLVLGGMAIFSNAWLEEVDDGTTSSVGLSNMELSGDMGDDCEMMAEMMDAMMDGAESTCDGDELTTVVAISDYCAMMEGTDADDCDKTASAGTMGSIGMWGGVVFALLATLMMVLPMAGVDAMDAIPEMGQKVISWGAGGLMLLGMVLWYFMLPDGDSTISTGLWMAGAAMSIALGSTLIGQFIPSDE